MTFSFHRRDNGFTRVCGHRGYSLHFPENTLLAFEETKRAGGSSCEIDILLSRDEEVIVLHDMTLERTTNGFGYAGDHDWSSLSKLDAGIKKGNQFAGTRIPTFKEAVEWAKANNFGLEAELKDDDRPEVLARRVVEILKETDGIGNVMIISFDHKALLRIKELDERIRVQPIIHARHADLLHVLEACKAESVAIEFGMFDADDVRELHDAGYCNRVHMQLPSRMAPGWAYGRDPLPKAEGWIRDGLIDTLSGDDVPFLRLLVDRAEAK